MKKLNFILIVILSIIFLEFPLTYASKTQNKSDRVLVLPFKVFGKPDYSYLKDAVPEMLVSRLFVPSKVEPVDLEEVKKVKNLQFPITQDKAKELAKKFHARYVIWGSITVLGNTVSIDARLMDVTGKKKTVKFFQELKDVSQIIPQLTLFAQKSLAYIQGTEQDFYRQVYAYYPPAGSITQIHPEKGFYYYVPYLYPPMRKKPKIKKAYSPYVKEEAEGFTSNLVIDLSTGQIGWAEDEEENSKQKNISRTNATANATFYGYPGAPGYYPVYPYSPPPYYYYQEEDEGWLSKLFPFLKKKKKKSYQTQVIHVNPENSTSQSNWNWK